MQDKEKDNGFRYLNNEIDSEEEGNNEEEISEATEDEIIDNNCIDEDEQEFIEQSDENGDKDHVEKNDEIDNEKNEEHEENEENENKNEEHEEENEENEEEEPQKSNKNEKENQSKQNLKTKNNKNQSNNKKNYKNKTKNNAKNKKQITNNHNNNTNSNQIIKIENQKPQKNKFQSYYSPKFDFAKKKHKKVEQTTTPDDLFAKALEKSKFKNTQLQEQNQEGDTVSTKVVDILYDKYIGKNGNKVKNLDVITKMKEEEVKVNRDALRTKDDPKRINDMLNRQEDFEALKLNKLKEREKVINDKINEECIFMPNGINTSTRTPTDFYKSQLKFIEKKEDNLNQIYKNIMEDENRNKNVSLTSKVSVKIASAKNPNESMEDFCKRLYREKLKTVKESIEKPKEEKKLTKEQVNSLSDKLYKEGQTFRNNKDKKQKEKIKKDMKSNREEFASEKTNKVLLDKFISYCNKVFMEIFNKNDNFQISLDEYKLILTNMGCINPNSQIDESLAKESFYNYLKPNEDKIDIHSFLVFGLAALGIYKGNDEPKKTTPDANLDENRKGFDKTKNKNEPKAKTKTSTEIIKMYLPDIDLNKYGYTNKVTKAIKQKYLTFVKGLNNSWIGDNSKKKKERREKLEESQKREEATKTNRVRAQMKNDISESNDIQNNNSISNSSNLKRNNIPRNNKIEDVYRIIQQKKENDLKTLKAKKEAEELALCTFQPKINNPTLSNNTKNKKLKNEIKKNIEKNIEKLYQEGKAAYIQKKKLGERDPEDNEENRINCTFKPVIRQYNNEMFNKNPLKEDMQKFEKIREHKLNNNPKEYEKPMNFAIESKLNKEDIVDRVVSNRNNYRNEYTQEEKSHKGDVTPLLKVEVNLDEKNNTDKIIIYPGDNIREKTIQFCLKHKLDEEKKNTLLSIILEKMKESKEYENVDDNLEKVDDANHEENNNTIENEKDKENEGKIKENENKTENSDEKKE